MFASVVIGVIELYRSSHGMKKLVNAVFKQSRLTLTSTSLLDKDLHDFFSSAKPSDQIVGS